MSISTLRIRPSVRHLSIPLPTASSSSSSSSTSSTAHFYQSRILTPYASHLPSLLTLRHLISFGRHLSPARVIQSANHVRKELPVRLAHRIRMFQSLPYAVMRNEEIHRVYDLYWKAFNTIRTVGEIRTMEENHALCEVLRGLLSQHRTSIPWLVTGIRGVCEEGWLTEEEAMGFLMLTLKGRLSRRVLAEQHLALTEDWEGSGGDVEGLIGRRKIGMVDTRANAGELVRSAVEEATQRTWVELGAGREIPEVRVEGALETIVTCIPKHVRWVLTEILWNAMRVTTTRFPREVGQRGLCVTVAEGGRDVTFRVSDHAGGMMTRSGSSQASDEDPYDVLHYRPTEAALAALHDPASTVHHTTEMMTIRPAETWNWREVHDVGVHLGLGMLMARVYMEYWNGSMRVKGMSGWGSDVYVRMGRWGTMMETVEGKGLEHHAAAGM